MKPIAIATHPPGTSRSEPPADDGLNVDDLLEESAKAARYAVARGDGGTQEIAYHMEALRLAMFAIVVAIQDLGRDLKGGQQ
jgi:hypothetical protein